MIELTDNQTLFYYITNTQTLHFIHWRIKRFKYIFLICN